MVKQLYIHQRSCLLDLLRDAYVGVAGAVVARGVVMTDDQS